MHPNPIFRAADRDQNLAYARDRGFGILAVCDGDLPLLSHVPFVLSEDGTWADLHLVRSNPIVRLLKPAGPARLAVSGPDGYVSPDWYGLEDQVPTWNYIAVHLMGELELRPQEELRDLLERQSDFFEQRLAPKPVWRSEKMAPEALDRMMRMIVPLRLNVAESSGTWKLSQNKPEPARRAVCDSIEQGSGADLSGLAQAMRDALD
ncbi:FMN-binding negative transcriptional regulator [Phaeobacter sp. 11ANDIMAR09]|uniref:FMN-binding negative transcriptional regulator n=1 Tax=Phaeobacter sp. 11ANDIMAR09 TaxID=1225647 RepID=UPI0006C8513F|nr:FMN-binding negative transcriptional regulator [Phaeobacter sp. 11ANDIMAR09]KPD12151.1 negative transcriptional regulator [Phaeobacter sp. 11ANDIMAR09]OIQ33803.1 MAG: negative transcriptional regulator [Roseobacter sp. MedPE-SWchi]